MRVKNLTKLFYLVSTIFSFFLLFGVDSLKANTNVNITNQYIYDITADYSPLLGAYSGFLGFDGNAGILSTNNFAFANMTVENLGSLDLTHTLSLVSSTISLSGDGDIGALTGHIDVMGNSKIILNGHNLKVAELTVRAGARLTLDTLPYTATTGDLNTNLLYSVLNNDGEIDYYIDRTDLTNTWFEFDSRLTATYNYLDTAITNTWIELDSRLTSSYGYLSSELSSLETSLTNTWIELDSRLTATYEYLLDAIDAAITSTWIELDSRLSATYDYLTSEIDTNANAISDLQSDVSSLETGLTNTWIELDSRLTATYNYLDTAITNTWIELDSRLTATYNYISNIYHYIPGDYYFDGGESAEMVYRIDGTAYLAPGNNVYSGVFGGEFNNLHMNDGTITLSRDLIITSSLLLDSSTSGTITNDGSGPKIVFMYKDQNWEGHLTFTGDTILDCNDQEIDFNYTGRLFVGAPGQDAILVLRNLKLKNLPENWLTLVGDSDVVFDYNVRVE